MVDMATDGEKYMALLGDRVKAISADRVRDGG